jgi:hypothetical protein
LTVFQRLINIGLKLGDNRMSRLFLLLSMVKTTLTTFTVLILTACSPTVAGSPFPSTSPSINVTVSAGTAVVGTAIPGLTTQLPPVDTLTSSSVLPLSTLIPTLPAGLSPTTLKYLVLAQFPDFFYCDPDFYPVARADELSLALQRFPQVQANPDEFNQILTHNHLTGVSNFSDDQKLLIYREHKRLAALPFELTTKGYTFQLQVADMNGAGELITGSIDGQGKITVQERTLATATCPICLASGTLIDTPTGPIPVQNIMVGTLVWTIDRKSVV